MASPRYGNIFETSQNIAYDYCAVVLSFQIVVRGNVHFIHLWFGLFTSCLPVISKLILCLPEVLFLYPHLTAVKTKQNKTHSVLCFSLTLVTISPHWKLSCHLPIGPHPHPHPHPHAISSLSPEPARHPDLLSSLESSKQSLNTTKFYCGSLRGHQSFRYSCQEGHYHA